MSLNFLRDFLLINLNLQVEGFEDTGFPSFVDGYIYCSVKHPIVFISNNQNFDLNQPLYILMATGSAGKGNLINLSFSQDINFTVLFLKIVDNIERHSKEEKSSVSIDLADDLSISYFKDSSNHSFISCSHPNSFHFSYLDPKGVLKQLHGSFMVIAWLMAASTGLLMPRYMKKTWVGKQFMKKDLWFVVRHPLHAVQIYYRKCVMVPVNRSTTED
jgi:hypothetical protein